MAHASGATVTQSPSQLRLNLEGQGSNLRVCCCNNSKGSKQMPIMHLMHLNKSVKSTPCGHPCELSMDKNFTMWLSNGAATAASAEHMSSDPVKADRMRGEFTKTRALQFQIYAVGDLRSSTAHMVNTPMRWSYTTPFPDESCSHDNLGRDHDMGLPKSAGSSHPNARLMVGTTPCCRSPTSQPSDEPYAST
eukprot:673351-Amphidinium_carterae.1